MPSKSKSQQRLFGMALAVRKGELDRSEVGKEVLDIVDGEMTDKQIEDFAKKRTSDRDRVSEGFDPSDPSSDRTELASDTRSTSVEDPEKGNPADSPITKYLKTLKYAGKMKPMISVSPSPTTRYVFAVVKPGFSKISKDIIDRMTEEGFSLYKTRTKMLTEREARLLYKVHKEEDFYDALCKYMSSDYTIGLLFTYPEQWKKEKAFKLMDKVKDGVRADYSESDMRNAMHSSDSEENMRFEMSMYFNELY